MSSVPRRDESSRPPDASGAGESAAFDDLMRTHYPRLCNFALRFTGSRDVAEDIVQDVFLGVWRRRVEFTYDDPLPYLYQAVRNRAVMHARRERVRERWREQTEMAIEPPGPIGASDAELSDLARALAAGVESLPERCRLIFTMSREQELTYAEIARVLGISIKTVETQMGRALKALRSHVADFL